MPRPSALALGLALFAAPTSADAAGSALVKFFVTEFRLKSTPEMGAKIELELRGRASIYGSDKVEFKWKVPDAAPYLEVLKACNNGSINGAAAVDSDSGDSGSVIEGSGPLAELSCRVILK
jgi:hypothetical protein